MRQPVRAIGLAAGSVNVGVDQSRTDSRDADAFTGDFIAETDREGIDRAQRLSHMVPMKRVGTADEIASAIVWLMSDDASYVTSAILDVSGGR